MAHNATLKTQLEQHLAVINEQIEEVRASAAIIGCEPKYLRLVDGSWPLIDLLVAQSSVLLGLSNIAVTNKK